MTGERGLAEVLIVGVVISSVLWVAAVIGRSAEVGAERHPTSDWTEVASLVVDNVATCDAPSPPADGSAAGHR